MIRGDHGGWRTDRVLENFSEKVEKRDVILKPVVPRSALAARGN